MTMDKPEEGETPETVPLMCDGFDDAVIGVAHRCGQMDLVVYDTTKIVKILVKQGMTRADAFEYFEFNIAGAWLGPGTPLFLDRMPAEDIRKLYSEEENGGAGNDAR